MPRIGSSNILPKAFSPRFSGPIFQRAGFGVSSTCSHCGGKKKLAKKRWKWYDEKAREYAYEETDMKLGSPCLSVNEAKSTLAAPYRSGTYIR